MTTAMIDAGEEVTCSAGTAIKNLAKIYGLPPFVKLFQSNRTAIVIVHRKYAEQWRAALGGPEFVPDREGSTVTWESTAMLLSDQVRLIYGTHDE